MTGVDVLHSARSTHRHAHSEADASNKSNQLSKKGINQESESRQLSKNSSPIQDQHQTR